MHFVNATLVDLPCVCRKPDCLDSKMGLKLKTKQKVNGNEFCGFAAEVVSNASRKKKNVYF